MRRRQLILLAAFFLVAAGLAYFLQDTVNAVLFVPLSYLWWAFSILYQSVAQVIYWLLLVLGVAFLALGSLYGRERSRDRIADDPPPSQGPLGIAARQISRTGQGMYYKWLIANRMGKLARSILQLRNGTVESPHSALEGRDWGPPDEVASYLVSGLMRTFADYPRPRWYARRPDTPFDVDLDQVVSYLESQMESPSD
jgi:hypothetical protein